MKLKFKAILGTAAILAGMLTLTGGANAYPPTGDTCAKSTDEEQKDIKTLHCYVADVRCCVAASNGQADTIRQLLESAKSRCDGKSSAYLCYSRDERGAFALNAIEMLDYKPILFGKDFTGRTPLMHASTADVVNVLTESLNPYELRVLLDAKDSLGRTALHLARNAEVAKRLVELGADLYLRDEHFRSPLHYLVKLGDKDLIKWLVEEKKARDRLNDRGGYDEHGNLINGHTPLFRLQEYIQKIINEKGEDAEELTGLRAVEAYLISIGGVSK